MIGEKAESRMKGGLTGAWKVCQSCITYLLIIIALIQCAILVLSYFNRELPVPRFLFKKIESELAEIGVYPQTGEFYVDLTGKVFVRNLKIALIENDELLVSSEAAHFSFQLSSLMLGQLHINTLRLSHTTLYLPALYSASGVNEPVIERLNCNLQLKGSRWQMNQLNYHLHNLQVEAGGSWKPPPKRWVSTEPLPLIEENTVLPELILDRYYFLCSKIIMLNSIFREFKSPTLTVTLHTDDKGMPSADLELIAHNANFNDIIQLGPIRLKITDVDYFQLDPRGLVTVETDSISWLNMTRAENLKAKFNLNSLHPKQIKIPKEILLAADKVWREDLFTENLVADIFPQRFPLVSGNVLTQLNGAPLKVSGTVDFEKKTSNLDIISWINIDDLTLHPLLNESPIKDLSFNEPPRIGIKAVLNEGFKLDHLDYTLDASQLTFRDIAIDRITVDGSFFPPYLFVDNAVLENNEYRITGSYKQNLIESDFRMLLTGTILPSDFNSVMEPWWPEMWSKYKFLKEYMYTDMDYRGYWNDKLKRQFYGELKAENLEYKGLLLQSGSANIWAYPGYVRMFNIESERSEGNAAGSIDMFFALDPLKTRTYHFDIETQFTIPELSPHLGEDVAAILDNINFSSAPRIHYVGMRHLQGKNEQLKRDITFDAVADKPHTIYEYPFDDISFQGHLTDDFLDINNMDFGIGGGRGSGNMHFRKTKEGPRIEFDLLLKDALYMPFLETTGYKEKYLKSQGNGNKNYLSDLFTGKLDIYLNAVGVPGDLLSFEGEGWFSITKAELGKFQIVGLLSRLFGSTILGFTPLGLETAGGDFILDRKLIHFPKITFTGPYSIVRADGNIILPNKDLDFRVFVSYLENKENPFINIIGIPFFPLGQALQLRLRGTLAEPQWRFALDPRRSLEEPTPLYQLDGVDLPQ